VNTSPEPFSNITLSLFEDGLVAGLLALAIANPVVTLVVVVVFTILGIWLVVKFFGAIKRIRARRASAPPAPG
jgi:hypothetical protein